MLSRIQDLPRFKADLKRFQLGIDSTSTEVYQQGLELLKQLVVAVKDFDLATGALVSKDGRTGHMDHVSAQERVRETKDAMEIWMTMYAPNIHVDEKEFEPQQIAVDLDK